jgi:hypothetical protein
MWLASSATRSEVDGGPPLQDLPSITQGGWGEPDVALPATSAGARAEIAELESVMEAICTLHTHTARRRVSCAL